MPLYGIGIPMWAQGLIALLMAIFTYGYVVPYVRKELAKTTIPYKKNRDATHAIVLDVIDCPLGVLLGICLLIPKVLGAVSINTGSIRGA